ncbi:hypothetical protein AC244_28915 [Ensifer adhaerens]|uniref:Uncharacterized protein n=1 Tax=Ensifer adhaerens TaxID=106592 RepID=A0A0L8BGV5_ENSAD|nr:hypothetical protein AC244_28915 [Ensifer adhaerens]
MFQVLRKPIPHYEVQYCAASDAAYKIRAISAVITGDSSVSREMTSLEATELGVNLFAVGS